MARSLGQVNLISRLTGLTWNSVLAPEFLILLIVFFKSPTRPNLVLDIFSSWSIELFDEYSGNIPEFEKGVRI